MVMRILAFVDLRNPSMPPSHGKPGFFAQQVLRMSYSGSVDVRSALPAADLLISAASELAAARHDEAWEILQRWSGTHDSELEVAFDLLIARTAFLRFETNTVLRVTSKYVDDSQEVYDGVNLWFRFYHQRSARRGSLADHLASFYVLRTEFEAFDDDVGSALCDVSIAELLTGSDELSQALECMFRAQPVLIQFPNLPLAAANLVNIAVALQRLNDAPTARKYYIEALQVERLARPSAINCTILHNLALLEKTAGEYEQARMWYERALNCARTIHNVEKEYSLLAGMVDLDLKTGDLERAAAGLVEVDDAILPTLSVACRAIVTSARWKQAFARGDMEAAEQAFEQAIGLTREFRRRDDTMKLLREYLDLYGSSAPAERLLPLSQELVTLQDELQRDTAASVPRSVEVRLAQQQAIRELELNKEREKLDVSIAAREQTVREVGTVLHDDVGQSLTVIGLQVDNLLRSGGLPAATLQEVTQVRSQLRRLTEHVRELSHALSAQHLETAGLGAALLTLAEEVRSAGVDVQCVTWGETEIGERGEEGGERVDNRVSLSPEVRLCLYRCAQTALQNALRHGEATSIELQLGVLDDETMVSVNDNGRGFDQSVISFGLGLRDSMNRIERLGGTVYIDSRPGRGTFVKFTIPHSGA